MPSEGDQIRNSIFDDGIGIRRLDGQWHELLVEDKTARPAETAAGGWRQNGRKIQRREGVDHVTARQFERQLPESIWELSDQLKFGTYEPQPIRRVHIPKPGTNETRPLGIPTARDRVVQAAIVNVIEPIFERDFAQQS